MGEEEKRFLTIPEVKDMITSEAERRELTYEQTLALGHTEKFAILTAEDSIKLAEELEKSFEFIGKKQAYKMADLLPGDIYGIKAIFSRDRYTPSEDDCNKIIAVIRKYI